MEIVNGVLSGVMVVLAVLVAGIVVLWCLCRVLDGMALAFTGTRFAFAASGRLFEAVRREHQEMLARIDALKKSQRA